MDSVKSQLWKVLFPQPTARQRRRMCESIARHTATRGGHTGAWMIVFFAALGVLTLAVIVKKSADFSGELPHAPARMAVDDTEESAADSDSESWIFFTESDPVRLCAGKLSITANYNVEWELWGDEGERFEEVFTDQGTVFVVGSAYESEGTTSLFLLSLDGKTGKIVKRASLSDVMDIDEIGEMYCVFRRGTVYVLLGGRARVVVGALEAKSCKVRWQTELAAQDDPELSLVTAGERVIVSVDKQLVALSVATGQILWSRQQEALAGKRLRGAPLADQTHAFYLTTDEVLAAVSIENGEISWLHEQVGAVGISELGLFCQVDGGYINKKLVDGALLRLDPHTGGELWKTTINAAGRVFARGGRVVLASDRDFAMFDAKTGANLWCCWPPEQACMDDDRLFEDHFYLDAVVLLDDRVIASGYYDAIGKPLHAGDNTFLYQVNYETGKVESYATAPAADLIGAR